MQVKDKIYVCILALVLTLLLDLLGHLLLPVMLLYFAWQHSFLQRHAIFAVKLII